MRMVPGSVNAALQYKTYVVDKVPKNQIENIRGKGSVL